MTTAEDEGFMRRAIALAASRLGRTGANPAVGCVIVQDREIVGEAATGEGGRPHAEEQALAQAGAAARGAIVYVTLEPCAARSSGAPSCSERLIRAEVARVVIGSTDASIHAAGQGGQALRVAGIIVESGFLAEETAGLYQGYNPR